MSSENEVPQEEQRLLAGAERRIGQFILALIPFGTAVAAWRWNLTVAGAFSLGGGLAYLNYRWIVSVVDALSKAQHRRPRARDYLKLFAPLVLLVVFLYAIFNVSWSSATGVLTGVLLLVPAVILEALVQLALGSRR